MRKATRRTRGLRGGSALEQTSLAGKKAWQDEGVSDRELTTGSSEGWRRQGEEARGAPRDMVSPQEATAPQPPSREMRPVSLTTSISPSSRSSSRSTATCAIQVTDHCCQQCTTMVTPFQHDFRCSHRRLLRQCAPLLLVPRCAIDGVVQEAAANLLWSCPARRHDLPVSLPNGTHQRLAGRGRGGLAHGQRVDDLFPQRADRRVRLLRHVEDVLQHTTQADRLHWAAQSGSPPACRLQVAGLLWSFVKSSDRLTAGPPQNSKACVHGCDIGGLRVENLIFTPGGKERRRPRTAAQGAHMAAATARPECAAGWTCLQHHTAGLVYNRSGRHTCAAAVACRGGGCASRVRVWRLFQQARSNGRWKAGAPKSLGPVTDQEALSAAQFQFRWRVRTKQEAGEEQTTGRRGGRTGAVRAGDQEALPAAHRQAEPPCQHLALGRRDVHALQLDHVMAAACTHGRVQGVDTPHHLLPGAGKLQKLYDLAREAGQAIETCSDKAAQTVCRVK